MITPLQLSIALLLPLHGVAPLGDDDLARTRADAAALREAVEGMRRAAGDLRLVVNGEQVSPAAVQRSFVYVFGKTYIERKIRDFLVADEIAIRRKSGQPIENLEVRAAEVQKEIDAMRDQVVGQMPGFRFEDVIRVQGFSPDSLVDEQTSWLIFDRVFIPEDAAKWSETTKQAVASAGGEAFLTQMVEGLKKARETNPNEPFPPFYRQLLRQWVVKEVRKVSTVKMPAEGLPPEIALQVNEWVLPTADAYRAVASQVTAIEREKALRWIAFTTAVRQELVKAGAWLSEEEAAKAFHDHEAPYLGSPLNMEVVALGFKKFPTYDTYREYFRLRRSFEKMIEKEITDEALAKHAERVRDFLGEGRVDVQMILKSAMDYTDFQWKGPDAFDQAKTKAEAVLAAVRKGDAFEAVLDRESEFFDAPVNPNQPQQAPRPNRGKFGMQNKNTLKQLLGETEFDELLRGYSIGEVFFHDVAVGEVAGPIRGPLGYYVGRVVARQPGHRPIDLAVENSRTLVREDYLTRRFLDWSNEIVAGSKIELH